MKVAFTTVLRLRIDDTDIMYDGWTPWVVKGFNTLDPLGVCVARPRISSRIYPEARPGEAVDVLIVCKDDRLTVLYDGAFIVDRMLPQTRYLSHTVQFSAWGGQWLGLDVIGIEAGGDPPRRERIHPVR